MTRLKVYCLNRGQGQAWYTDVSLVPVSPERLASVFPIKFGCEPAEGNAIWNGGKAVFNTFADNKRRGMCQAVTDVVYEDFFLMCGGLTK